ncbi:MAG TPA: hypothetical protein VMI10_14485 [Terriglobales bacterium]|nr:hypothetical protein [Terriglobales bacterium]
MKRNLMSAMAAMILMLAVAAPTMAQRQTGPVKVTVPFGFALENDHFKAGDYTVERIANGRLRIRNEEGSVSAIFLAIPAQEAATPEKPHFVFNRYGNEYFLSRIWMPGQQGGWEVLKGKYEVEIAKRKTTPVETAMVVGR